MINLEFVDDARMRVEQRERDEREAAIRQEAANAQHRAAIVKQGEQMSASVAAARERKRLAHEKARAEARAAKDALTLVRDELQQIEERIGRLGGDLIEAEKTAVRCVAPSDEDFPTPAEIEVWQRTRDELDQHVIRLRLQIDAGKGEHRTIQEKVWHAQAAFERAREAEMLARNDL